MRILEEVETKWEIEEIVTSKVSSLIVVVSVVHSRYRGKMATPALILRVINFCPSLQRPLSHHDVQPIVKIDVVKT
jgi:hypothetical protein